jgi:hypothetical protein
MTGGPGERVTVEELPHVTSLTVSFSMVNRSGVP